MKLTSKNFQKQVIESELPALVEFSASWCPPCQVMKPIMGDLAEEWDGKIKVMELNIDQNSLIADLYKIRGVPTFILFKGNKIRYRTVGARSKKELDDILNKYVR